MLIRRCAWHRQHFGYSVVLGIAEWSRSPVAYTDGICRSCATLERRRLTAGDAATAAAARTMRRRALGRALAVVVTTAAVAVWITSDFKRHRDTALRAALPVVAPAGVTTVARAPAPSPPRRPEPAPARTPAPTARHLDRYVAVSAPAGRVQSFGQLARAVAIAGRERGRGRAALEAPRPSAIPAARALPSVHAAFEQNPTPPATRAVSVALAAPPPASRDDRAEAP